jgi:hypothetical protein
MTNLISFFLLSLFLFFHSTLHAQGGDSAKNWYELLPDCPCRNPDFQGVKLGDGWAKDKGNLHKYHLGAAASFRSYPAVRTKWGYSCQQCCYDTAGNLITSGRGAGTPDKISACKGENGEGKMTVRFFGLIGHYFKDVRPWTKLMRTDSTTGWQKYNSLWLPNAGKGCNINVVAL